MMRAPLLVMQECMKTVESGDEAGERKCYDEAQKVFLKGGYPAQRISKKIECLILRLDEDKTYSDEDKTTTSSPEK